MGEKALQSALYALDIFGTFAFAIAGALKAARHELDALGVLVLATATGVGGGMVRDVLLAYGPPAVFHDNTYLAVCIAAGLLVFFFARGIAARRNLVRYADAVGLGVFTAIGGAKAMAFGLGGIPVVFLAVLTATGGGVIRDILVGEVPVVLRTDFYATASILGAVTLLALAALGRPPVEQLAGSAVVATGLRLMAIWLRMRLPRIPRVDDED